MTVDWTEDELWPLVARRSDDLSVFVYLSPDRTEIMVDAFAGMGERIRHTSLTVPLEALHGRTTQGG